MDEKGRVYPVPLRQVLATQPISAVVAEMPDVTRLVHEGWIIEITGDAVVVKCAGTVTTSMRTGQLGQVTVRRDPPNSRGTELVG